MLTLVVGSLILFSAIAGLVHPWISILGWTWISIMNPHVYSWQLRSMPVGVVLAGATMIGLLVTRDRRQFFVTRETVVLMLFMLWVSVTLPLSFHLDPSLILWNKTMKIDVMILVALMVLHSRRHIIALASVLAFSIGFYGVKGGLFTLATGGNYRVWGPENSYIEGNNEVALAFVIAIPLIRFVQSVVDNKWIKWGLTASMVLCAVSALGSQSRGALLALSAMGAVMWWRSDKKLVSALALVVVGMAIVSFMPESWWSRMNTINTYQQDASALGRINAWWAAWNIAKANVAGGGYMVSTREVFAKYAPDPEDLHAAHSIYFMVLGEHGFIGLFLFILLWALVWFSGGRLRIEAKKLPETEWLSTLGAMCQVSLAGYAVGGAFLSLSYWDLPYNLMILVVLGRRWVAKKEWILEAREEAQRQIAKTARKRAKAGGVP